MSSASQPLLQGHDLCLSFGETKALVDARLEIAAGEVVAVMGPSGSGKSTLLHVLAGILLPDQGTVIFDGDRLSSKSDRERSHVRLTSFGFVFQFGDLVPELTLGENVALPLELTGVGRKQASDRAHEQMASLGVDHQYDRRAGEASGGQVQRAAVARALVGRPAVVFADEPTGALDTVTGEAVLDALVNLARADGSAVVLVTHENRVAAHADREIILRDGRITNPQPVPSGAGWQGVASSSGTP